MFSLFSDGQNREELSHESYFGTAIFRFYPLFMLITKFYNTTSFLICRVLQLKSCRKWTRC